MKTKTCILLLLCTVLPAALKAQKFMDNFTAYFLCDVYHIHDFYKEKHSDINDYSAVGSTVDQFRLQEFDLRLYYISDKIIAKLSIQNGDGPELLTSPQAQFIHYIDHAYFGFRISKKFWADIGYMPNPIGLESSKPSLNLFSPVSMGGYFEPGNILGVRLRFNVNDKLSLALLYNNSYTYYDRQSKLLSDVPQENLGFSLSYRISEQIALNYNNSLSDIGGLGVKDKPHLFYNNLYCQYKYKDKIHLDAQCDLAMQNHCFNHDSSRYFFGASLSGLVQLKYFPVKWFGFGGRGEIFYDPNGILSNIQENSNFGIKTWAVTGGVEFIPQEFVYLRAEYCYMKNVAGQYIFNGGYNTTLPYLMFTSGLNLDSSIFRKK